MRKRILSALSAALVMLLVLVIAPAASQADTAPESVVLSANQVVIDLAEDKYARLQASVLPEGADRDVDWSSSDRNVVRVSSSGKLTGRKLGTAVITAVSEKDETVLATCTVTVVDSDIPERILLSQNTVTIDLAKSNSVTLTAAAEPAAANQRVRWKSSSSSVASVSSSSGKIRARKPGVAVITAASRESSDVYAECVVNVIDTRIPEKISFEGMGASISLDRYETLQLTPVVEPSIADQNVRWKSSKSSVVYVSSKGVLTAKRGGTATITCYSKRDSSVKAVLEVTVNQYPSPDKIELSPATTVMVLGETLQLNPVTYPENTKVCEFFTWKSSSSRRASVDENGLVTAKQTGWVTITCTSKQSSRVRATRKILVVTPESPHYIHLRNKDTGALLNDQIVTVNPTDTIQLVSQVLPEGKNGEITWKSSSTSRARVDENGFVTALKAGEVTITATSKANREVKATFKLKIVNLPAPDSIQLTAPAHTIEITDTLKLTATTLPLGEKRSQEFKWYTSSSSTARVSSDGVVTPRKVGTVTITVKSSRNSRVKATYVVNIIDSKMPDSVTLAESGTITIENGQKLALNATVSPATATQTLRWTSSSSRVLVDENGVVTGVRSGSATISAISTYSSKKKDTVKIKVVTKAAPTALALSAQPQTVMVGKTTRLTVTPTPANASVLGTFASSNPAVATVDADGVVTAHAVGTARITLTSLKNSAVSATIPIVVYDDYTPGGVTLSDSVLYLTDGDVKTVASSVFPATAPQTVTWSSSNSSIASVDADGVVRANGIGTATISATTSNGLSARCKVSVTSEYVATTIPARTTTVAGIADNMKKINDIKESAKNQILNLMINGTITSTESTERQQIIDRAFEMQLFPWMTESIQPYWTSEFAYKQYVPGNVYYGLPYIQKNLKDSYANREYNVEKAVRENRYTDTGKGYYLLNRDNLLGNMYVGTDCSSFMGIAQYGIKHPAAFIRTKYIVTSSYYETIDFSQMRPGDMLVMGKNHVVMFLYWVDHAKTQMMIIEQGGDGNTVICSIKDLTFYSSQGYIARRRVDFK